VWLVPQLVTLQTAPLLPLVITVCWLLSLPSLYRRRSRACSAASQTSRCVTPCRGSSAALDDCSQLLTLCVRMTPSHHAPFTALLACPAAGRGREQAVRGANIVVGLMLFAFSACSQRRLLLLCWRECQSSLGGCLGGTRLPSLTSQPLASLGLREWSDPKADVGLKELPVTW